MKSRISIEFGRRVRLARERRQIAIEELACEARISWHVLVEIESGAHFPSPGQLERLLSALEISWHELNAGFLD